MQPQQIQQDPAQGAVGDECIQPGTIQKPNLAGELRAQPDLTFGGYAESVPDSTRFCYDGNTDKPDSEKPWKIPAKGDPYVSKHAPWLDFADARAKENHDFLTDTVWKDKNYSALPTVSFVIPNNTENNMHSAEIPGDERQDITCKKPGDEHWSKFLKKGDCWLIHNSRLSA